MNACHTPGPWTVDIYGDVQANGHDVARIATDSCAAADAALIAAAPELLEVLQRIVADDRAALDHHDYRVATDAIAKATGNRP